MEPVKIIYQKKYPGPRIELRRRTNRTQSPNCIKDQSSKLFRIQVHTPTFYRPTPVFSINNRSIISPIRNPESKPKKTRISYRPSSNLYARLNVRLTLKTLELFNDTERESRQGNRSRLRKTINFTTQNHFFVDKSPLEARGSSINSISLQ